MDDNNDNSSSSEENSKKNQSESESSKKEYNNSEKSNDEEQLINYFSYISECSTKIEENRQNYFNKLSELKTQIENIKTKKITSIDYTMLIITDFVTLCDSFYSSFAEQQNILKKFTELNDSAQNINFCYEKEKYSNMYYQELNKKAKKQYEKIYEENQKLSQIIKELKANIKSKNNLYNEQSQLIKEKEIKNKMDKVIEENIELKRRCSQILQESKIIKEIADEKFVAEQENKNRMSTLLNKIDLYEDKIGKMQQKINEYETERVNTENEMKNKTDININNRYENEKEINLDTNKSELSENISVKQGFNLEELLVNPNDVEEEKLSKNIKINNEAKTNENYLSVYSSKSIKRYNEYDIDAENDTSPNFLMLCPINQGEKKKYKHEKTKHLSFKSPFSLISPSKSQTSLTKNKKKKNAKSLMNEGINQSYYKIFFFLLLRSIIINRDMKEFFKKYDFDLLYEECENRRIPFHKYEEWIIDKFKLNGDKNNKILYDGIINDCFICSSLI